MTINKSKQPGMRPKQTENEPKHAKTTQNEQK